VELPLALNEAEARDAEHLWVNKQPHGR
jgi:hypothetical protein